MTSWSFALCQPAVPEQQRCMVALTVGMCGVKHRNHILQQSAHPLKFADRVERGSHCAKLLTIVA